MKKLSYMFIVILLSALRINAQDTGKAPEYKVPAAYRFDYKVVYEMNNEERKAPETVSYYFTKNGDYMSMETPENQKGEDMNMSQIIQKESKEK